MKRKIVSADDAVRLVRDHDTITTSGFVGIGVPEELLLALERRFLETGEPRNLGLLFAAGQGDGKTRGLNRLGHEGLLEWVIGGHWGLIPKLSALCLANKIKAYNLPQGVISQMFRDIAAGKVGTLTHVGLETFVDPRLEGGRINDITTEQIVEVVTLIDQELLLYKARPIDIAFLRGTTADITGNVSMEHEALTIDNLSQAMAVKNSGGLVIVQVERTCAPRSMMPREVVLPGALVDAVVVARPENHMQTYATQFSHYFSGQFRASTGDVPPITMGPRKIIARRAAFELPVNGIVNLGIGMPEGVADVAGEEGLLEHITLTAEPGVIGGQPASGLNFGAAINLEAVVCQNQQFDLYDGGGLDLACLGMAECDPNGNVNVSRFGHKLAGAGGFINISQNARAVVFAGTFTAGGLETRIEDGNLVIVQEGQSRKFRQSVGQVTYSGDRARRTGQRVLYVTERCVFEIGPEGISLTEVAPGIDIDRDILAHMEFAPTIEDVVAMDPRIFVGGQPMGLSADLLHLEFSDRLALDDRKKILFINFEKLRIRSQSDVDMIRTAIERICAPLGHPVDVVVNYDGAKIDEDIEAAYAAMVHDLEEKFYGVVTRYSGSSFLRMKLGKTLIRGTQPHIFETAEHARSFVAGT